MTVNIKDVVLKNRLVAVIRLDDLANFQPLAVTLLEGGVKILEFTLTNLDSLKAVEALRQSLPIFDSGEAIIGIGSVRSLDHTRQAIDAGAQFLVSPIMQLEMVAECQKRGITSVCGAYSPTEIATAAAAGADFVKVFPADTLGPAYFKGVLAAMPELRLIPTGGVTLENLTHYLKAGCVAVGVGGALINPKMIALRDWDSLRQLALQYAELANKP
ncbi:MAG: bifunctional 4-hydroxy-2-oxoglutarate aldolase/2-dehydro-3-deoxy-phosphogluconate aldolase [Anaerolineae bacterium]|nr:bifunctional 4-hydroxy-2-oxoglutarate aldolase/2-dehydro-3-deoxy-phosphogluconate aldolase [Anaerolineae bacterium]